MLQNEDFSQKLMELYAQTPFDVFSSFSFQIGEKIFLPHAGQEYNLQRKKLVTDFDGVFEAEGTEPLYKLFFRHLRDEDINPLIESDEIDSLIKSIFEGKPITDVFSQMRDYLKSKNLTEEQYSLACQRAAEEWQPNEKAWETVKKIKQMGYSFVMLSGSSQQALGIIKEKIGMESDEILGTQFVFEKGELKEIYPMLGEKKLEKKKMIIEDEEHIAVTDDMYTDYLITVGAGLSIIVGDKDRTFLENEKQVYIYNKSIKRDFGYLADHIQKFEYAFVRSRFTTTTMEKRIIDFIKTLKTIEDRNEFLVTLKYLKFELEEFDIFSSREREEIIYQYKTSEDIKTQKRLKEVILSMLKKELPEFENIEAFEALVSDVKWN
jgi:phosphoserine phosphatase